MLHYLILPWALITSPPPLLAFWRESKLFDWQGVNGMIKGHFWFQRNTCFRLSPPPPPKCMFVFLVRCAPLCLSSWAACSLLTSYGLWRSSSPRLWAPHLGRSSSNWFGPRLFQHVLYAAPAHYTFSPPTPCSLAFSLFSHQSMHCPQHSPQCCCVAPSLGAEMHLLMSCTANSSSQSCQLKMLTI